MLLPAILDSSIGQFSSFTYSSPSPFYSFHNNMNSSSSNSNEKIPTLGFNSPPLATPRTQGAGAGSNLSRPRLVKMRKQASSHNPRFNRGAGAGAGAGSDLASDFNPFRASTGNVANDTFLFGATTSTSTSTSSDKGVSSTIHDDMMKLRIDSHKNYANPTGAASAFNLKVFGSENKKSSVDDELPREISKLNIGGGSGNVGSQGVDAINRTQFTNTVFSNPVVELRHEMNKMNLKDPAGDVNNLRGFVFGKNSKAGDGFSAETVAHPNQRDEEEAKSDLVSDRLRESKVSGVGEGSGFSTVFGSGTQSYVFKGKNLRGALDHSNVENKVYYTMPSSHSQAFGNTTSMNNSEKKVEFVFTSKLDDMGAPNREFNTPNTKGNLFSGVNNIAKAKKESAKDTTRSKTKKWKLKKPITGQSVPKQDFAFNQRSSPEKLDTFESYSPMDVSPYNEAPADNYSRETSVSLDEVSQTNDHSNVSSESHIMISNVTTDEDLLAATQRMGISDGARNEVSEAESYKSANENLETSTDTFLTALDSELSSTATSGRHERAGTRLFSFASKLENISKDTFTFGASSSPRIQSHSQSQPSTDTRHKKKHRLKTGHDCYSSTLDAKNAYVSSSSAEFFPDPVNPSVLSPGKAPKVDISMLSSKNKDNSKPINEPDLKRESVATASVSNAAQEACEKWRLRGNQAYSNGDLAKAEDCYTQGLDSVSQSEKSRSCLRALMLCYSNRAATRISLGRMREALKDCLMAAAIDPNFLKVQVRAAHCYLALGEVENAKLQFVKCLQSGSDVCVDRKLLIEASDGLEKAQKVSECIKQYADLLQRRTSEDLERALRVTDEALQISTYSEKLLQMKADALLMLRRYEQVIQLCEQPPNSSEVDTPKSSSSRLWRPCLIVKSYFYLGRLEEALKFIKNQEYSGHIAERLGCMSLESAIPLADTIRELLSHKAAGNEAYKSGRHAEAVEHYTAALSCSVESRPFAAICYCNRAAAYRALGQITDAIADCSLSIALDPNYLKAISRRASLYELIRDYGQAATDLQRLVSILTTQVGEKGNLSELRQTQLWLSNVEEESRKEIPLNMYLILGVEPPAAASDVKKAYRKAALKYHPDKAALSLSRSDIGDDELWKEIAGNVHKDADRLFKMIGEAYAVLSNPSKRSRYDLEEEMRNDGSRFTRSSSSKTATDAHNTVYERSGSRRQWNDSWRPYVNTQSKGSEKTGGSSYRYARFP